MKAVIFLLLVALAASYHVRAEHQYWYTANRKAAETGVPFADVTWNYCDVKCTTLEKLKPGFDFFVVNFQDAVYKPNFSACYAKAVGTQTYQLWNKVITNDWYEKNCGSDSEDYLTNSAYKKTDEAGVGVGVRITY